MKHTNTSSDGSSVSTKESSTPSPFGGKASVFKDLAAAITFFTRVPIWKWVNIPQESYKRMIYFWPLTGWFTSGVVAGSFYVFSLLFPPVVAIVLALAARVIFTGGFHEDGLGDFFDGFGGGRTKADVLRIMKDSHAGSYSVLGLVFYFLLLTATLSSLPAALLPYLIVAADPFAKFVTSIMMNVLPYARPESESKSKTTYDRLSWWKLLIAFAAGCAALISFLPVHYWYAAIFPFAVMLFILFLSKKKIEGYTGDVCGATALLCELSFYLGVLIILSCERYT